ncbi:MAG TPA: enoyl-CoA hydratase/isomerase family protein [Bordetella sp.]|jgi:E-phenylitaconyl-CoA hydratase|nr:enoyl-CoA hydratase/isomerase family protein [Bordetella sp.]
MSVIYEVQDNIAVVRLNRPEAMNAIDPETAAELRAIWLRIAGDATVRCVILTAAGERAFCTGSDLKKTMPPKEGVAQLTFGAAATPHLLENMDKVKVPIICAINGYAVGGGLELALACDIRIASGNARVGLPEVCIGSLPGGGGTQRLPRAIGLSNAMLLLLTGDIVDAQEALRVGLVSKVTDAGALLDEARRIAARIAGNAPLAVGAIKRLVQEGTDMPLAQAMSHETMAFGLLRDSEDRIEGRLAFQQKRKPVFQGK